jgi:gas vesicle protein
MSEQGSGVGAFLLGLGLGAALGFLFAPEAGVASRAKLARRLREVAAEKLDELEEFVDADEDTAAPAASTAPAAPAAPAARAMLARRLSEAKRRRRSGAPRSTSPAEEDEPLA